MIKFFRIVGLLEGLSYILLLFVGMPLKYVWGNPMGVKALGMPHGLLFVLYIVLAVNVYIELEWPKRRLALAFLGSLLPFGTIIFDKKYLSNIENKASR